MTIINRDKAKYRRPQIDLSGPDGNALVLLGMAKNWAKQLDLEWEPIQRDAMSGDYEHLVSVLDKHFGDMVDFIE